MMYNADVECIPTFLSFLEIDRPIFLYFLNSVNSADHFKFPQKTENNTDFE